MLQQDCGRRPSATQLVELITSFNARSTFCGVCCMSSDELPNPDTRLDHRCEDDNPSSYSKEDLLHWAASKGYEAVVAMLLEGGADVTAKYEGGQSVQYRAAESGDETLVRLVEITSIVGLFLLPGKALLSP
jgi:hypothetical protein